MRLALVYTTFPKRSETFLQREAVSLVEQGVDVAFFSILGSTAEFRGRPVHRLGVCGVLRAILKLPVFILTRPSLFRLFVPPQKTTLVNYCENLLGLAAGVVWADALKECGWVHAQWGAAPAMAAYAANRLNGLRYSMGLHAYDLFEAGGDGWLKLKVPSAAFVTSSNLQAQTETRRRFSPKVGHLIRRGLPGEWFMDAAASSREGSEHGAVPPVRIITVGRLLPKKGFAAFIDILAALDKKGINFGAELIGAGPLAGKLRRQLRRLKLTQKIKLTGWLPAAEVMKRLREADLFVFTGCVAPNGDRDGFPNVIAEAFACGCVVVARDVAGVSEGVLDGETGVLLKTTDAGEWCAAIVALLKDPARMQKLRQGAATWARENFDAAKNARRLAELAQKAVHQNT